MLKALIFDFDGLILDTEMPSYQAWEEIYREYGAHLAWSDWVKCIGASYEAFDPYAHLERQIGRKVDRQSIRRRYNERRLALIAGQPILPGVAALIAEAREAGLRLAVASSSSRAWVAGHLERLDLLKCFAVVKSADDVARVKPDPALYLAALRDLGVGAAEAIALEDSANGLLAAKRAGLYCVAVPNALTRDLPLDAADMILESLAEANLALLRAAVEARTA